MTQPPPQPQQRGFILDTLSKVLEWLDSPWKAFALVGIAIVIGLGYGGWMSRDALVDTWKMSSGRPILKRSELTETLRYLRAETDADIVALWSLKLEANAMNFEDGMGRNLKRWEFTPRRLPAIRDPVGPARGITELMSGHVACRAVLSDDDGDLFTKRMLADDIHRLCIIPVPPAPNILVGLLIVAWVKSPDKSTEEAALGLARETASTMVSRWE